MTTEPLTIELDPDSELVRTLTAHRGMVRLDVAGTMYRVNREEADPWVGYDPAPVRAALRGSLAWRTPRA